MWGNKWIAGELQATLEYICPDATERKYMPELVEVLPNMDNWSSIQVTSLTSFDFSWRPDPTKPPQIYQWPDNGPRYTVPGATDVIYMSNMVEANITIQDKSIEKYKIKTTLKELILEHPNEVFWAINSDLNYDKFDFSWRPETTKQRYVNVFGTTYSKEDEGSVAIQTYFVNGPAYILGYDEFNYVNDLLAPDSNLSMFWVDRGNNESQARFDSLKSNFPQLQKTRFLNTWVDTINRCTNKTETTLFWVLSSELDYSDFSFDFYPNPWQMKMVHVFGTQWSHWGNTFMINKETFAKDTKYVKIIEHLPVLNFVKTKRVTAANCLYDIALIDHNNPNTYQVSELIKNKSGRNVIPIEYNTSYLQTFTDLLEKLPTQKEHYIWICSSICNYDSFDFSYVCDPFTREQLHVFPSDKQKFGDTFLVDVNKLRSMIGSMTKLEDFKINFNNHLRNTRIPCPVITIDDDTHINSASKYFDFPYAVFETEHIDVKDTEPMNLWTPQSKAIIVSSTGGTRIVMPREARQYIKKELYDYPYIITNTKLAKSKPMDIVFLSNGETSADENYEHLLAVTRGLENRVVRVDGVDGRVAAYHATSEASTTPWAFTVFAKLKVSNKFDWNWQPDRLQMPKHYIFHAKNPVNGLVYGHQAMIAYNKKLSLANQGKGLDFTLDDEHEVIEVLSGMANFNTDPWSTWRTAFRECIKLRNAVDEISAVRLDIWREIAEGDHAEWSLAGANDAVDYWESVNGDIDKLKLSYEWEWLRNYHDSIHK